MTKDYVWNSAICRCEDGKCLASIMNDSAIMCDESYIKKTKTTPTNIIEKKQLLKLKGSIFYLHFYQLL